MRYRILMLLGILLSGCIEPYNPPEIQNNDSYLVVEGYLDAQSRSCTIKLTRTIPLTSENDPEPASGISIWIEDEDQASYILKEQESGVYLAENIIVGFDQKYRLLIEDGDNKYESDFVEVKETPPINELTWNLEDENVKVYVNTINSGTGTSYYLWSFEETWQYSSAYRSYFVWENGSFLPRGHPDELYYCWQTDPSTEILVGTSAGLDQDVINNFPVRTMPMNSRQLQAKYSILVKQFTITKDAYDFWSQMRDNTQGTGSIFDVQPSRVQGNIHSVNNSAPIIGYFSVGNIKTKRLFISSRELPVFSFDTGNKGCYVDTLLVADFNSYEGQGLIVGECIYSPVPPVEIFLGYTISTNYCVDCRERGGSNIKPEFWE